MVALILFAVLNLILGRISKYLSKFSTLLLFLVYLFFVKSTVMIFFIAITSLLIYFFDDPKLFTILMILAYVTSEILVENNLVILFIYFEVISLITLFIIVEKRSEESLKACLYYALIILISSSLMIIGIGFYFSSNYNAFKIFFTVGFIAKSSLLPFFFLPFIYPRISSKKLALLTLLSFPFFLAYFKISSLFPISRELILLSSISSSIFSSVLSLGENNIKRVISFSCIIEYSILFILNDFGTFFYFLRYYVLSKIMLFLSLSKIVKKFGSNIKKIIWGEYRISSSFVALSVIYILGFPPSLGFFSKLLAALSLRLFFLPYLISLSVYSLSILRVLDKIIFNRRKNIEKVSLDSFMLMLIFLITIIQTIEVCTKF